MLIKKIYISVFVFLFTLNSWAASSARFGASPDNSQSLLLETIRSAKSSIALNIYMITSSRLTAALVDRLNNGVSIKMLVEAEPFGKKIVSAEKKVLDDLSQEFAKRPALKSRLFILTSQKDKVKRRYVFDHAKYVVVDEKIAYISSENFVNSGVMTDPDRKGNRGWQVSLSDETVANDLLRIFAEDTDTNKNKDVVDYDPSLVDVLPNLPPRPNTITPSENDYKRTIPAMAIGQGNVTRADLCLSPRSLGCITQFIASAKKSLEVQHLSLPLYWPENGTGNPGGKVLNPIVDALVKAARNNVKVRVLLQPSEESNDDGGNNNGSPPPSIAHETVTYLNTLAAKEKLALHAEEINVKEVQIKVLHNKGMIADDKAVFISSINGTENSVNNNREVGVAIQSEDGAKYYKALFDFDWKKSSSIVLE